MKKGNVNLVKQNLLMEELAIFAQRTELSMISVNVNMAISNGENPNALNALIIAGQDIIHTTMKQMKQNVKVAILTML